MEPYILDSNFNIIRIVDDFESMIWTDRYSECGDFEIYTSAESETAAYIKEDYYIFIKESDRMMITDSIEIQTNADTGNHIIISGKSLEYLLHRRVIWNLTIYSQNYDINDNPLEESTKPWAIIKYLINSNIADNPDCLIYRRIPNFEFKDPEDPRILDMDHIDIVSYFGENLYDTVVDICNAYNMGFKITYDWDRNKIVMSLYMAEDRSYNQDINPHVVFSPRYENLINSDYKHSKGKYVNVIRIRGEGEGLDQIMTSISTIDDGTSGSDHDEGNSVTGFNRYEGFSDKSSTSSKYTEPDPENSEQYIEVQLSDAEYIQMLKKDVKDEEFENVSITETFSGEVDYTTMYTYDEDYYIGDIVQIINEFGIQKAVRITEYVRSEDNSGSKAYPTFEVVEEDN